MTVEIRKRVPVVADVDVLVAGGGIAGSTAALTAARDGARAMIIERFGCLGGNMGPGMWGGGVLYLALGYPMAMLGGLKGIPGEFIDRCQGYADGQLGRDHDYFKDSQVVSYVWSRLMQENGVRIMLNAFAGDPIMEGTRVAGLIVESRSGTQAIRAKTIIDATGDADVAARAGAPVDQGQQYAHPGMYFAVGNVDDDKYLSFLKDARAPSLKDLTWLADAFQQLVDPQMSSAEWVEWIEKVPSLYKLVTLIRKAWEIGEYRFIKRIGDSASVYVDHGLFVPKGGILGAMVGAFGSQASSDNAILMSELELEARIYIFETARFLRHHVPGFENSHLHMIAPYFHCRGGRSIVSEYRLTMDDVREGRRFDDVVFVAYERRSMRTEPDVRVEEGNDFPFRQLLPQGVEGLLVAGRAAVIQPPCMRDRWKVFLMGQAAGVAAAISSRDNHAPRAIDVKQLQRQLYHKYHAPLGTIQRIQELGLS